MIVEGRGSKAATPRRPMSIGLGRLRSLDLRRLLLDQLDQVVDDVGILQPMVRHARDIDLVRAVAAAGEADVGLARLARAVHDAADHRHRHRRGDVGDALLQRLDGADHVVLLARAGRAGDEVDAAMAQAERLQHLEADADLFLRLGRQRDADRCRRCRPTAASRGRSTTSPCRCAAPPASVTPICSG